MRAEDLKQSYEAPARAAARVQRRHPNATLSAGSGSVATIIVWGATAVGVPMDAAAAAAFATMFSAVALLIGRKGLKGVVAGVWRGNRDGDDDDDP